jgi:hypothetical protein
VLPCSNVCQLLQCVTNSSRERRTAKTRICIFTSYISLYISYIETANKYVTLITSSSNQIILNDCCTATNRICIRSEATNQINNNSLSISFPIDIVLQTMRALYTFEKQSQVVASNCLLSLEDHKTFIEAKKLDWSGSSCCHTRI